MTESTMDLAPGVVAPAQSKTPAATAETGGGPKLAMSTKLSYGVGSVAAGVGTVGLSSAVLQPYLNRVIGLPALWVGAAIMVSLMVDAVVDPMIGQWSDNTRSRWGRRHPFMYVAAPLAALVCYTFWHSPTTWSPAALGVFLIVILLLLRLSISLFEVPCNALAPEL